MTYPDTYRAALWFMCDVIKWWCVHSGGGQNAEHHHHRNNRTVTTRDRPSHQHVQHPSPWRRPLFCFIIWGEDKIKTNLKDRKTVCMQGRTSGNNWVICSFTAQPHSRVGKARVEFIPETAVASNDAFNLIYLQQTQFARQSRTAVTRCLQGRAEMAN